MVSVVTDKGKNAKDMDRTKLPDLINYGCGAHWFNLLGQDLIPLAMINKVVEVPKYFRNHHKPSALLKQHVGALKPQLPGETRWNSQLSCVDTFLINRPFYLMIAECR